jgi:nucleoside-diphosphate-sugar epimerase
MSGRPAHNVVCVTGARSQLGVFLLPRLRAAGFRVQALSRDAPDPARQVAAGVSWLQTGCLADGARGHGALALPPPDHLVSCGPLDLARRLVLRHPGLRRVVAFSSSSVIAKADSGAAGERAQMAAMALAEAELIADCAERDLHLLLLRPTLIWGCGLDRNVSLLADLARRRGVIPLAGPASGLRQPVHADDLAELAVRALQCEPPLRAESPACGGETLSYREMATRIAAAAPRADGRKARLLSLPVGLLAAGVGLLSLLPRWRGLNAEMARRQNRDLVFDDHELRKKLGWHPRPFEPTPADFEIPQNAKNLQLL